MIKMATDIEKLKDPSNIKEAEFASTPYVLRKVFESDPLVQRLIRNGHKLAPLIKQEIENSTKRLPEITLACMTYILYKVDPEAAVPVLLPIIESGVERPGPFSVHFAAHFVRLQLGLPTRPQVMAYNGAELAQTLQMFRKVKTATREK